LLWYAIRSSGYNWTHDMEIGNGISINR